MKTQTTSDQGISTHVSTDACAQSVAISRVESPHFRPRWLLDQCLQHRFGNRSLWLLLAAIGGSVALPATQTLAAGRDAPANVATICCAIVELRQYTLHAGQRDVLIDLFNRKFIEPQEAVGIRVIGQFRDQDNPDRFVWLRGFADMPARAEALKSFYYGDLWKANRSAANATIIDNDNVLLLRPARADSGFAAATSLRSAADSIDIPKGFVVANLYYFDAPVSDDFLDFFERALKPEFMHNGANLLGAFVSERSVNTFPALPVREGENVFACFALFADEAAYERYVAALEKSASWHDKIKPALLPRLKNAPEVLRLTPTARSQIHA
ncbi:NIPSNAP family containing protein [Pseudolysobacter antarcticus]|uniref:NIPSNAP family containing protein n=1 Tax=Pseudolysobacter antarcticus TaxID=2511995 RepID=A0A411HGV6_9GAMM|nr:NIPSNAP family protein [Pseudolysobacter antarcticus]QBB69732.1 NIPSNAP family containing protein [Pseudolysobacter antarcticus]